jgi:hypothetical protein
MRQEISLLCLAINLAVKLVLILAVFSVML